MQDFDGVDETGALGAQRFDLPVDGWSGAFGVSSEASGSWNWGVDAIIKAHM